MFAAVNIKAMAPAAGVTVIERGQRLMRKVELSGGGRCNCTNTFASVTDLRQVYPRGHRLMGRLMREFGPDDAMRWFNRRGVELVAQDDGCVFPASQDARTISGCLRREAGRLGVQIVTGRAVSGMDDLQGHDLVVVTTGGSQAGAHWEWLRAEGVDVVSPVPSLFSLRVDDHRLTSLMGTVVPRVELSLPGTPVKARGPLLITHWGLSGPATLRLSSHGARLLSDHGYHMDLRVNWMDSGEDDVRHCLRQLAAQWPHRLLTTAGPPQLPQRLWSHLVDKHLGARGASARWENINQKETNRLVNGLCNDSCQASGRAPFKDEFVTCGGVALEQINPRTLECKRRAGLYFAGEVMDVDGVTGGFNFQAAWTTAYVAAKAIAQRVNGQS